MRIGGTLRYRDTLKLSTAASVLGAGLLLSPSPAHAQQIVPGDSAECPITVIDGEKVAICEGDLADGITAGPGTPDFKRIVIRNPDAPIAPPGYAGIELVKNNGDLTIDIEDGVRINVFHDPNIAGDAQGIFAITQEGFDLSLTSAADVTADGNGGFARGIEAVAEGGGVVRVSNDGDIIATATGDSATALQARADLGGGIGINNSGVLRAESNGSGEREAVTAGILGLGFRGANVSIINNGDIFVTTSPDQFDTDFNGVAGAIVGKAFMDSGASGVSIINNADLTVSGNQTHGIVAYAELTGPSQFPGAFPFVDPDDFTVEYFDDVPDRATVGVATIGKITTNGDATYGVLAQAGGTLSLISVSSSSDIDMTAPGSFGTGIFAWSQSQSSLIQVVNAGAITGSGDAMSGIKLGAFGAPAEGEYLMTLDNDGDIAFDAPAAYGITLFATTGDNVSAEVDNSGDINLSNTTDPGSIGISVNFAASDANETRDGTSRVTLTNSGEIEMGAGSAIVVLADQIDFIDNVGVVLTEGDQSDVVRLGSAGGPAQISARFNQTVIGSLGDESNGIAIEPLADASQLSMILDTIVLTTTGTGSNGFLVEQLGEGTNTEFTIQDSVLATFGQSSDTISIAAIGQDSAMTFDATNSIFTRSNSANGHAVLIGGLAGIDSVLNVNLLNTTLLTEGDTSTVFEIANYIQTNSISVLTVSDANFTSRGDDSVAIAVGTASTGPIDRTSQTISIEDTSISTEGDRSTGIFIDSKLDGASDSDFGILVNGVEISTEGESAHGIEIIGAQNATIGDRDNITAGGVFADIVINATADITAAGVNSDAIRITQQDRTFLRAGDGATVSGGTGDAYAIRLMGIVPNSEAVDEITGAVTVAKAKITDNAQNIITDYTSSGGEASTIGPMNAATNDPISIDMFDTSDFAHQVTVDDATVESMMGAGAIAADGSLVVEAMNGAIIRSGNDDAPVISAVEALAILASDTSFSSTGANAPLFSLTELNAGDGKAFYGEFTGITATTTGANSDAIATGGGVANSVGAIFLRATHPTGRSTVSTTGDGSHAISFDGPIGSSFTGSIADSDISTTGADAAAILLDMGGTSSASLELFDSAVSTSGSGSDVVRLNTGGASDYTFIIADSELRSEGDDSALLRVTGRETANVGNFVMIGGTLSSTGDGSGGIIVDGNQAAGESSHTFFLAETSIATEGDNSGGFVFGRDDSEGSNITSFTFDAVDITTQGADSDAFYVGTQSDNSIKGVTITNSSFVTASDNSRAMVTELLGENSVQSVTVANSRFETLGNNSAAITVNDLPEGVAGLQPDGSILSIDIGETTISTQGDNSLGIDVASLLGDQSTTVISMSDNQISTAGANSDAVSIGTQTGIGFQESHTFSMDFMDYETTGDDSRGTYIGSLANGIGGASDSEDATDATFFIGEGSITTSGARSHGIEFAAMDGDFTDAIVDAVIAGDLMIDTSGADAIGILWGGLQGNFVDSDAATDLRPQYSVTMAPLSVATNGAGSHGIQVGDLPAFDAADNADVTLTIGTREITTTGAGAHGVVIGSGWGDAGSTNATGRTGSNRYSTVTVTGAIDVSGAGSDGIVSDSLINAFEITETGSVTSADGFALNFATVDDGQSAFNLGTIDGDVIFGDGDDVFDNEGTFTGNIDMGAGANAIFVRAGGVFNSLDEILLGMGNAITVEGDLSPGGVEPFQTTAIGSDLVLADGSRLLVDIDGMTADATTSGFFVSDRVTVDGDISIGDSTLAVSSLTAEGDFDRSAQFLILDASGALTGEFSAIDADLPFLDLSMTYEGNRVILNAGREGPVVPFASLGQTPNQRAVGAAFDQLEPGATGDLDDVIDQLIFASTDQALTAFDSVSGEIYASLLAQAGSDGLRLSRDALSRSRQAVAPGWAIWGGVSFSDSSIDGDGNGARVEQDDLGFDFGIDYVGAGNQWAAGISTGYRDGDVDIARRASSADYEMWYLTAHARYGTGGAGPTIGGAFSYGETDANVTRTLTVNALSRTALGQAQIDSTTFAGEARYGFAMGSGWAAGPVVSVQHVHSDLSLDNETGAGSVALTSADASDGQTRYGGGLFLNLQDRGVAFDLSAQYVEASSNTVGARLAFADGGNAPFTVLAPVTDGGGVSAAASASIELGKGWTLGAQFDAFLGGDQNDISGAATIGWRF
ncbi:hypothetical protein [Parasphingorhabdus sp.]|uniref:hypothetical protein n=1 Tax=Parasphingorhabdus sp. TaxID=2709688 RepID=UPI003A9543A7